MRRQALHEIAEPWEWWELEKAALLMQPTKARGWLAMVAMALASCGADKEAAPEAASLDQGKSSVEIAHSQPEWRECSSSLEAATELSTVFFTSMPKMVDECAEGDVLMCNPANYVLVPLAGVFFAPMGFAIGLAASDEMACRD